MLFVALREVFRPATNKVRRSGGLGCFSNEKTTERR